MLTPDKLLRLAIIINQPMGQMKHPLPNRPIYNQLMDILITSIWLLMKNQIHIQTTILKRNNPKRHKIQPSMDKVILLITNNHRVFQTVSNITNMIGQPSMVQVNNFINKIQIDRKISVKLCFQAIINLLRRIIVLPVSKLLIAKLLDIKNRCLIQ